MLTPERDEGGIPQLCAQQDQDGDGERGPLQNHVHSISRLIHAMYELEIDAELLPERSGDRMLPHARSFGAERRRVPESYGMATRTGGLLRVECALLRRTIDERAAHENRAEHRSIVIRFDGLEP
jgi:transposase